MYFYVKIYSSISLKKKYSKMPRFLFIDKFSIIWSTYILVGWV